MITRHLPVEEWPRLQGTELESVWPLLDPQRSIIIVVENDEGAIVGCWSLFFVLHAECLWIREDYRKKASVARRLWGAMLTAAKSVSAKTVITNAVTDDVKELLSHVNAMEVPGTCYSMRIH